MKYGLLVFVSLSLVGLSLTCFWGSGVDEIPEGPGESDHWPPPPGLSKSNYNSWRDKYYNEMRKKYNYSGPGMISHGDAPPPWAVFPAEKFKGLICFHPPERGTVCARYEYRYAYNPDAGECMKFVYNGCGGNSNNFLTKKRCEQVCKGPAEKTCKHKPRDEDDLPKYKDWNDLPKID